jgi:hypothetical protein
MSRESEVVTYLRTDETLGDLLPGGIYAESDLPVEGLTEPLRMTDVWAGGTFQATAVVRQAAPVPTGDLQDVTLQHTSVSQRIEIWVYATTADAIEAALDRVYALLMGKRFNHAFSATWVGSGLGIGQAPELPSGIKVGRNDYRIVFIRKPEAV